MKFSLFVDTRMSAATRGEERQRFRERVRQVQLADRLGYHCIWHAEHHGQGDAFEGPPHGSAPEIFLSYCATLTESIRLGLGISHAPGCSNHPLRCAERLATLDVLSGGRVSWGCGQWSSGESGNAWREMLEMVPQMWQPGVFEHHGEHFDIAALQVQPKPVQDPHPPILATCSDASGAPQVGKLGIGVILLEESLGASARDLESVVADYRAAVMSASPGEFCSTNHFAVVVPLPQAGDDAAQPREWVSQFADAGVDELILRPPDTGLEATRAFAEKVVSPLAA